MTTIKVEDNVVESLKKEARPDEYYSDTIARVLIEGARRKPGPIDFGDIVSVSATAHRVIREDPAPELRDDIDWSNYPVIYHGRGESISREVAETGNWPPRDGRDYARVCRKVLPEPTYGIVVGRTLRVEGRPVSEYSEDGKEGWLEDQHAVTVYEIALSAGWKRKARIVLAMVDDVKVTDKLIRELQ